MLTKNALNKKNPSDGSFPPPKICCLCYRSEDNGQTGLIWKQQLKNLKHAPSPKNMQKLEADGQQQQNTFLGATPIQLRQETGPLWPKN